MKAVYKMGRLTRRSFLKTAAVSAGTTALAGVGSKETMAAQQHPVPKWDYEAAIMVLGIGGAGLVSAIAARDQGADVFILEKASEAHAGGNTRGRKPSRLGIALSLNHPRPSWLALQAIVISKT